MFLRNKTAYYFLHQSSTIDYYPFGQEMPGRVYYASSYRMGFNGQWKDSEFAGTDGCHYEFKFREYDSRIGRFWSVDPLFKEYPWNSTYAFAENDVIRAKDLEGLEKFISNMPQEDKKSIINIVNYLNVSSSSFKSIYDKLQSKDQPVFFNNPANNNELAQTYFLVGGNYKNATTAIKMTNESYNPDLEQASVAEEYFHGGQGQFYGLKDKHKIGSTPQQTSIKGANPLLIEVEAKVWRAYSGNFLKGENYLRDWAEDQSVSEYFNALRSGDENKINTTEPAFRKSMFKLVDDMINKGGYEDLTPYSGAYQTDKKAYSTPFFDQLTKKDKHKN